MARMWRILIEIATSVSVGTLFAGAQVAPLPVQPGETIETVRDVTSSVAERVENGSIDPARETLSSRAPINARLNQSVKQLPVDTLAGDPGGIPVPIAASAVPALIASPGRTPRFVEQDGWLVVENEWVVIIPESETGRINGLEIDVIEQTRLMSQDAFLFVLRVRDDSPDAATAEDLLREFGGDLIDRNHTYGAAQDAGFTTAPAIEPDPSYLNGGRLGLIDTDLDESHSMLKNLQIAEADFVMIGGARPQDHGTSVASIIARHSVPKGTQLLAASAFYRTESGATGATSASLVKAIDWLVANEVRIINFSLTGPPNRTLETMIQFAQSEGATIVAAVGNDGPTARPLYPAAYAGVLGVTAVDDEGTPYRWANRGDYVDIAAIGVGVEVALPGNRKTLDSGTSYAAPVISAYLATQSQPSSLEAKLQRVMQPAAPEDRTILGAGLFFPDEH